MGSWKQALELSRRAVQLDPLCRGTQHPRARAGGRGQTDQAIACHREALRLNPRYVEALNSLGDVLHEQGTGARPLPLYQQAVDLNPRRPDSHSNLGFALLHSRQTAEAASRLPPARSPLPECAAHR